MPVKIRICNITSRDDGDLGIPKIRRIDVSALLTVIELHAHRIASLHVNLFSTDARIFLDGLISPLPIIEDISFVVNQESEKPVDIISYTPALLLGPSNLRRLHLVNAVISWDSHLLHGLQEVEIALPHSTLDSEPGIPTLEMFLSFLKRSPELVWLSMNRSVPRLPPATSVLPDPIRLVTLQNLKFFSLTDSPLNIAYLLSHLALPHVELIKLRAKMERRNRHGILDVLPKFNHKLSLSESLWMVARINEVVIKTQNNGHFTIYVGGYDRVRSDQFPVLSFELEFPHDEYEADIDQPLRVLESIHSFGVVFADSPLTHLDLSCDFRDISLDDWRRLLLQYPSLTHLKFTSVGSYAGSALEENERIVWALSVISGVLVCPDLQQLALHAFTMGDRSFGILRECLETRAFAGAPRLKKLIICRVRWVFEGEYTSPNVSPFVDELEYRPLA
ncbi:hypothetical protein NLI96_g10208 [Meripilus lineatus]|uniref:Uncharacterized protein n=1 Tax=Meripilus lineatus TaxID=2056292 RepID=A0AAD5Y9I1_9APHY|nr:hypothetical protein NLI96_g10208 [Physisporinus lineatus]